MKAQYDVFNTYVRNIHNDEEENIIANTLLDNFEKTQQTMKDQQNPSVREFLGNNFMEKIKKLKAFLHEYLRSLGINSENSYFKPVYMVNEDKKHSAITENHKIELGRLPIDDTTIAEISYLTILAHEYYHCTGSNSRIIERSLSGDMKNLHIVRSGAIITSRKNMSESSACEEGMTVAFEKKAFDYICTLYTKDEVEIYKKFQEKFCKVMENKENNRDTYKNPQDFIIRKLDQKEKRIDACASYPNSLALIEYLKSEIKDFEKKMEEFRIEGNFLPLARSIEERYGKGAFRKLVVLEAYNEDVVEEFIEKLKNKIK